MLARFPLRAASRLGGIRRGNSSAWLLIVWESLKNSSHLGQTIDSCFILNMCPGGCIPRLDLDISRQTPSPSSMIQLRLPGRTRTIFMI